MTNMRKLINIVESIKEYEGTPTSLQDVQRYASSLNVGLLIEVNEDDDEIIVKNLERFDKAMQGSGAAVMQALCKYADHVDFTIKLWVEEGVESLIKFYQQFGFDEIGYRSFNGAHMVRYSNPEQDLT